MIFCVPLAVNIQRRCYCCCCCCCSCRRSFLPLMSVRTFFSTRSCTRYAYRWIKWYQRFLSKKKKKNSNILLARDHRLIFCLISSIRFCLLRINLFIYLSSFFLFLSCSRSFFRAEISPCNRKHFFWMLCLGRLSVSPVLILFTLCLCVGGFCWNISTPEVNIYSDNLD